MSKSESFLCDHCERESDDPMTYRLAQIAYTATDDNGESLSGREDEPIDDETEIAVFDFCSSKCLHAWAMDMALDFPDVLDPTDI